MVTNHFFEAGTPTVCVTLAQAKKQLRIESSFTDEDDLIQTYVDAAKDVAQDYIGRSIDARNLILECDKVATVIFSANDDNDTITKIEYYAPGETSFTELDSENYKLRKATTIGAKEIVFLTDFLIDDRTDAIKITVLQGWDANSVPAVVKQAMKLIIADMYERREDREMANNNAYKALLRPYKKY